MLVLAVERMNVPSIHYGLLRGNRGLSPGRPVNCHVPRASRERASRIIPHSDKVGMEVAMGADDRNTRKLGQLSPPKPAVTKAFMKAPVVPLYRSTWAELSLAT